MSDAGTRRLSRFRELAENFGVSALAAIFVSGAITAWFEARLENSKERVAELINQKDHVDTSQNKVFAELGLYTGKVFDKSSLDDKDKLEAAIIEAQLQLNRLRDDLPESDQAILTEYETELGNLQRRLDDVKGPNDLGPIYVSAHKLLQIHDELAQRVKHNLLVSLF